MTLKPRTYVLRAIYLHKETPACISVGGGGCNLLAVGVYTISGRGCTLLVVGVYTISGRGYTISGRGVHY